MSCGWRRPAVSRCRTCCAHTGVPLTLSSAAHLWQEICCRPLPPTTILSHGEIPWASRHSPLRRAFRATRRASRHPRFCQLQRGSGCWASARVCGLSPCVAAPCENVFGAAVESDACSCFQVQRVDDLRVAVERERAALEQLQGMISSERKLLGEGARRSASPLPYPTAHMDEVQHDSPSGSEQERASDAAMRSSGALWPVWGGYVVEVQAASRPEPLHGSKPVLGWEDERKRRAAEKRAAFLASAVGAPADITAAAGRITPSHCGGVCVDSTEDRQRETRPNVCHDLFTAGSAGDRGCMPLFATCEGTATEERRIRAQQRRAAFLSNLGGNPVQAPRESGIEKRHVTAAMTDDVGTLHASLLPSLQRSPDTGSARSGGAPTPCIPGDLRRSSLPQSPFVTGTRFEASSSCRSIRD
jgi:hypothetical protein